MTEPKINKGMTWVAADGHSVLAMVGNPADPA